ncbi:hypothetical protein P4K96_04195 [Bacillus cereus]|nr:hypothetical protein [Bacillus cereus]
MSMSIDLKKLKNSLPAAKEPDHFPPGLFVAIEVAHNELHSNDVDWSSFTLADAEMALDHAMGYVDLGSGHPNQGNAIHEYLHNIEAISKLKRSRPVNHAARDVQFF